MRGTGCTGYEVAAALRASYDIYVELATHATLVLVLGLGQPVEALERLAHDFAETVRRIARPGDRPALIRGRRRRSSTRPSSPRARRSSARRGRRRSTRRSAGSRASRSPATRRASPRCCPGERITDEVVAYLRELTAAGARLHGAADPAFRTVRCSSERIA